MFKLFIINVKKFVTWLHGYHSGLEVNVRPQNQDEQPSPLALDNHMPYKVVRVFVY